MNNKGFTLIELMATIILLAIVMSVATVSVVSYINTSKEKSYDILIENIKIGAQGYFEECENDNIIETSITCPTIYKIDNDEIITETITIYIRDLLTYGFLKSTATEGENKVVKNPKTDEIINSCQIKVIKTVDSITYATSYSVENNGGTNCPPSDDYSK